MRYSFLIAALLSLTVSFSQDITLTKGETVNYLKKKLNEINGEYTVRIEASPTINDKYVSNPYLYLNESQLSLSYSLYFRPFSATSNPSFFCSYSYSFNPMYIDTIWAPSGGLMSVWLKRGNGKYVCSCSQYHTNLNKNENTSLISWPVPINDSDYANKIRKALLHLRDLLKAEDDPFGG